MPKMTITIKYPKIKEIIKIWLLSLDCKGKKKNCIDVDDDFLWNSMFGNFVHI